MSKFLLLMLVLLYACKAKIKDVASEREYIAWINNPENGCAKEKKLKNIKYTVKFMPPEFQAYKEYLSEGGNYDSLLNGYKNSLSVYFRIDPDGDAKDVDIVYADIYNEAEFRQRVYELNFSMREMISVEYGGMSIQPSLFNLENDYGISPGRGANVVFSVGDSIINKGDFTIVFDDEIFYTGVNKFKYSINKKSLPEVIL